MTHQEMLWIAMAQSAEDIGCRAEDFRADVPVIVPHRLGPNARSYLKEPILCHLVSYGNNVVAAAEPDVIGIAEEYVRRNTFYRCFETPAMHWLDYRLAGMGYKTCFLSEYYLPDPERIPELSCAAALRVLEPPEFDPLYLPEWSNALCADRKQLDVLGVGAYDEGRLVGLAACSADCGAMWQIGVDVLPAYRRRGIASAMTSRLAREILRRGKVPFYCSAWSNLRSVRNAVKSGFIPTWVELTVKPVTLIEELNAHPQT